MKTLGQTFLMGNHISFVSSAAQGAQKHYIHLDISNVLENRVWREGRDPGLYTRRVCCTLLEDGAACVVCLRAELQRKSAIIPLEQKINNTTDGSDNYAILPDLEYDITITQSR